MKPEDVLRPFIRTYTTPDSVVRLLYLLLQREVERNFHSLGFHPKYTIGDPGVQFARGLKHIFSKLPTIYDLDHAKLSATLSALATIDDRDIAYLHSLRTPIELRLYEAHRESLKEAIETYQRVIDTKTLGDDVSFERAQLRRAKDDLHELKEPDATPLLTPFWRDLLSFNVSFDLPIKPRFEGTHVLGAPGSGKTVLLKTLITQDAQTDAAVIVMAPKGDLIPTIQGLSSIPADRLVLVRPQDEDYPLALNIFDLGTRGKGEAVTSQVVTLLNYVFESILESGATPKQRSLLNYCIRLMLVVPGATLITLKQLFRCEALPESYAPYVKNLSASAQEFFQFQFGNKSKEGYKESKEQMLWRLDLLLENVIIERMFSQEKTLLDMNDIMAQGKILLIDTSIKHLGESGSAFLGRFFIALVALAAQQRDTSKPLRNVFVYIDEASSYLSEYVQSILDRAREARVGLILAHQHLSQLRAISTQLESSVHNTAIKFVGRCNEADASVMAGQMRADAKTLQFQQPLHFTLFTGHSLLPLKLRAGYTETLPRRSESELHQLILENRKRLCSFPNTPPPDDPKPPQSTPNDQEWTKEW